MPTARRIRGDYGESRARDYLMGLGYTIVATNVLFREGEIDIVACDDTTTVFVEVKYRTSKTLGEASEALTPTKRRRFLAAIRRYIEQEGMDEADIRADFIAIQRDERGELTLSHYRGVEL